MLKDLLNKAISINESSGLKMENLDGLGVEFTVGTITVQIRNDTGYEKTRFSDKNHSAIIIQSSRHAPGKPEEIAAEHCIVASCPYSTAKFFEEFKPRSPEELGKMLSLFKDEFKFELYDGSHPAAVDLKAFYSKYVK